MLCRTPRVRARCSLARVLALPDVVIVIAAVARVAVVAAVVAAHESAGTYTAMSGLDGDADT